MRLVRLFISNFAPSPANFAKLSRNCAHTLRDSRLLPAVPMRDYMQSAGAEKAEYMVMPMEVAMTGGSARPSAGRRRARAGTERAMRRSMATR